MAGQAAKRPKKKAFSSKAKRESIQLPKAETISDFRALCALALAEVWLKQQSLNQIIPAYAPYIEAKDSALFQELVFGSCRWFYFLQQQYRLFLNKPLHAQDALVECLLCIGTYQLLFTRIPSHASIHETVSAAEALQLERFKGLINALLRRVSERPELSEDDASMLERAIQSHPQWIQDKLKHNWPEHWQPILQQNNVRPPMSLRLNAQFYKDTPSANLQAMYLAKLEQKGISASASDISPYGIVLHQPIAVGELPDFEAGGVSVQDEAAQLSSHLLALQPRLKVLDACAAPGGKTCSMLEKEPSLSVLALDADATRAQRISENLQRLNLSAEVKVANAEELSSWWDGQCFDRILLDAPCSATGVIRRHPDIKLLRQETDITPLADLQFKLLAQLWQTLVPEGILLYATCSIFPQENSRMIARFLKHTPDAELLPIDASWGIDTGHGTQLFPQTQSHDGFFYARLRKIKHETR